MEWITGLTYEFDPPKNHLQAIIYKLDNIVWVQICYALMGKE